MKATAAVEAFRDLGKPSSATRMVGYAAFLGRVGWDGLAKLMDPESLVMLRDGFTEAGVDPLQIEFPDGDALYLDELRRSSHHPKVQEAVRQIGPRGR